MKKLLFVLAIFVSLNIYSQTIDEIIQTMPIPSDIIPGLSDETRTMLLADTAKSIVPYTLGDFEKQAHNESFIQLRTSKIGTIQLKRLPLINNSEIVCVIKTVCGKACDSNIRFYTTNWEKLDAKSLLPKLSAEMFFDKKNKGSEDYNMALKFFDLEPIVAEFEQENDNLIVRLDYKSYFSDEIAAKISPFIKQDSLTLQWNKVLFHQ